MGTRVAINGFGRIGRMVYRRALSANSPIEIVAVNGTADKETMAHLLKYDSIHGRWSKDIELTEAGWRVDGLETQTFCTRNPAELPWADLGIDVVIEATGKFCDRESAGIHLEQGAKKVIITAPAKGEHGADITIVMGVNQDQYRSDEHHVVSGASCTTNCLGPVVKVLHETFGIETGMVTTVHAYTNDQRNLDNPHKDLRRARACAESIIPTTTGAAKAIGLVIPELAGRLSGLSLRVPTPNVSIVDLVAQLQTPVSVQEVNHALRLAAAQELNGILGFTEAPLVSIDFNGDAHSAVIDAASTLVLNDTSVKVLAWYDNEWGYSSRIVDLAEWISLPTAVRETVASAPQVSTVRM